MPDTPSSDDPLTPDPTGPESPGPAAEPVPGPDRGLPPPPPGRNGSPPGPSAWDPGNAEPGYPGGYLPPPPPGYGTPGYPGSPPFPGYSAPTSGPSSSPLAGWGIRLVGWLIDLVITSVVGALVLMPIHAIRETGTSTLSGSQSDSLRSVTITRQGALLVVLIVLIYTTAFIGSSRGQTLGMMVARVKAVDGLTGAPIGHARALGRGIFEYLMIVFVFPWALDMLFPLWDPRRQTLHDKVARSIVIKVERR
jgi:uncharacterized RDD family membrane protein YckC